MKFPSKLNWGIILPLVLSAVAFSAYRQLLNMYFWHDDYTVLYHLIEQHEIMYYPYQFTGFLVKIFYPLFGLEPSKYLAVGLILFISANILLFYFLRMIFKNQFIAFFLSIIFASGYLGQQEMTMFIGTGFGTILSVNIAIITLIFFFKYIGSQKNKYLWFCFLSFFLTLETSAYRQGTFVFVLILLSTLFIKMKNFTKIVAISVGFTFLFALEYFFHITKPILNYPMVPEMSFQLKSFESTKFQDLINLIGTFWNLVFPYEIFNQLYSPIKTIFPNQTELIFVLPLLILSIAIFVLFHFIRPKDFGIRKILYYTAIFLLLSFVWSLLPFTKGEDFFGRISLLNGGILLIFFILLLKSKFSAFPKISIASLIIAFGSLLIFFLVHYPSVMPSMHRYLLATSFTPSIFMSFFISKELFQKKNNLKKLLSIIIFIFPVLIVASMHLYSGLYSQYVFSTTYSQESRKVYSDLKKYIKKVDRKIILYIDPSTDLITYTLDDSGRVGALGTNAAFGVQFKTNRENFLLPNSPEDIPAMLKANPDVKINDVYTFIDYKNGLKDTSNLTRELLIKPAPTFTVSQNEWQNDRTAKIGENKFSRKIVSPNSSIYTLLPLKMTFMLKSSMITNDNKQIRISWKFDTESSRFRDKFTVITLPEDGLWHEYTTINPGGGEYLKQIAIEDLSLENVSYLKIGDTQLTYQK